MGLTECYRRAEEPFVVEGCEIAVAAFDFGDGEKFGVAVPL